MSAIRATPQTGFKRIEGTGQRGKPLAHETILISITSFLTDVSTEMMVPLMPFFLTTILGASAFIVGLVEGWAAIAVSIMDMLSGRIS
ncbi:MAG: hypothetical protein QXH30_01670, partial [Candidatus Bilamarchaeaceae archaeon]